MKDVLYTYDGSFDGLLCCIFESFAHRETPVSIVPQEAAPLTLFPLREVSTDTAHARRVADKLRSISPQGLRLLRLGHLTCQPEREMLLYRLAVKLLRQGGGFLRDYSDETLHPVAAAVRRLQGEAELLRGFVRFSQLGGVLGSEIRPQNRVLPLLRHHFCARYPQEAFFIYDRTHREALFSSGARAFIRPVADFQMAPPDPQEAACRLLWKRFFDTVAIRERENPRLQRGNLPLRYRCVMTEFQPEDHFIPADSCAAVPGPGAPAGIPAPGTPPAPVPSAPGSSP